MLPNHELDTDVQDGLWEGHRWSPWFSLPVAVEARAAEAPNEQGLYRIRCRGEPGLIYIGETVRILARLRQLRKAMAYVASGEKEPGTPPHVAGGCILQHEQAGKTIEVSWMTTPRMEKRERRGIECELICAYRHATGSNPICQFAGKYE